MKQQIRTFNIKGKKNLQEAIKMAKKEITYWNEFLKLTERELEKYKKVPKKYRLNLPTTNWTK